MRCEQCKRKIRGEPYVSVTGRRLCGRCGARLQGRTAGALGGFGRGGRRATGGWYASARRTMGKKD